jgi:hypothetical protein
MPSYSRSRRRGRYNNPNSKVKVSLRWDSLTNATYQLRFDEIGVHWNKVEAVKNWILSFIPASQRELEVKIVGTYVDKQGVQRDKKDYTWHIGEKFFDQLKQVLSAISEFDLVITEKPEGTFVQEMHTIGEDVKRFKQLLDLAHVQFSDTIELPIAIKAYRRAALVFHPDRNPTMAETMSELNEIWARLKTNYFKDVVTT